MVKIKLIKKFKRADRRGKKIASETRISMKRIRKARSSATVLVLMFLMMSFVILSMKTVTLDLEFCCF